MTDILDPNYESEHAVAPLLSPAAQAVLDAFRSSHTGPGCLAAALLAVADQVVPAPRLPYDSCCDLSASAIRAELLAIAKEIETHD